jgi:hypothetical protein
MMGAAAGLHSDDARRKLPSQSNQRLAPHLTPHDDRPFPKSLRASEHDRPDVKQAREEWTGVRRPKMRLDI